MEFQNKWDEFVCSGLRGGFTAAASPFSTRTARKTAICFNCKVDTATRQTENAIVQPIKSRILFEASLWSSRNSRRLFPTRTFKCRFKAKMRFFV